jgi:hypothetical protein
MLNGAWLHAKRRVRVIKRLRVSRPSARCDVDVHPCAFSRNTHTQDEGGEFFRVVPDPKSRRAVAAAKPKAKSAHHLRVV